MRLDLADLRLFLCILEAGSITQGANKAHLALSSVSERMRLMEEEIGVPLLSRHARGIVATEAGKTLEKHAKKILKQHQQMRNELKTFASGMRGNLHLYANSSALIDYLPPKVAQWLSQHPDLHLELEEYSSVAIVKHIIDDLGEAGIVSNAVNSQGLILEPIADDDLVLIIPEHHPLNMLEQASFIDLVHEPFVGLYVGSGLQDHIQAHAQTQGYTLFIRIRMNTFEGMCEMVEKGVGLGIVPKTIADKYQDTFRYKKLALTDDWAKRQLCICYKDWHKLNPAMKNLLNYLKTIA